MLINFDLVQTKHLAMDIYARSRQAITELTLLPTCTINMENRLAKKKRYSKPTTRSFYCPGIRRLQGISPDIQIRFSSLKEPGGASSFQTIPRHPGMRGSTRGQRLRKTIRSKFCTRTAKKYDSWWNYNVSAFSSMIRVNVDALVFP